MGGRVMREITFGEIKFKMAIELLTKILCKFSFQPTTKLQTFELKIIHIQKKKKKTYVKRQS